MEYNMFYEELLAQAKHDPSSIDFTELRMSYVKSSLYRPYERNDDAFQEFEKAIKERNFDDALDAINCLLESNYLDIKAHYFAFNVFSELGNKEKESYHGKFVRGLLDSIFRSGNGQSYETAFVVINTSEEYHIINALGLKFISQALTEYNGHEYDVLECSNPKTGRTIKMYFNIDFPKNWLNKNLDFPEELNF
jgi:hypothetical protein